MSSSDPYIIVGRDDARMWARANVGSYRGTLWANAVKRFDQIQSAGGFPRIRWWSRDFRYDPTTGTGVVEVINTRRQRRTRP